MSDKKEGRSFNDIMSYWNVKDTSKKPPTQQQQPQPQSPETQPSQSQPTQDTNENVILQQPQEVEEVQQQHVQQQIQDVQQPEVQQEVKEEQQETSSTTATVTTTVSVSNINNNNNNNSNQTPLELINSNNWANISIASTNPYSTIGSGVVGDDSPATSASGYDLPPTSTSSYSSQYSATFEQPKKNNNNNNSKSDSSYSGASSYNQSVYSFGSYGQKNTDNDDSASTTYSSSYGSSNPYSSNYGYTNEQKEYQQKALSEPDTPKTSLFNYIDNNNNNKSTITDQDDSNKGNSWNDKFQEILDEKDSEEKFRNLSTIANEFVYCANTYGKIIISERNLPNESKTILPLDIGGIAGGTKFKVMDIIFKFVVDTEIAEDVWMYGDHCKSDEMAQKSAGHELKGLNHYMEHAMMNGGGLIRFPLMAIIDYRGYRLLAISSLPINKQTIVYGSCDGGRTVHDSDPQINEEMKRIAKLLNIKGHYVGVNKPPTFLYGPGDIEVHRGFDGRYYMIDFARCFPPEYPVLIKGKMGREIFYSMLRPELVALSENELSPDAFSGWQTGSDEEESNNQVIQMTEKLHHVIIPECVDYIQTSLDDSDQRELDQTFFRTTFLTKTENSAATNMGELEKGVYEQKTNDVLRMINEIHSKGINIRYLGIACQKITQKSLRMTFMTEVVARIFKKIIRSRFREKMETTNRPSDEPRQIVAQIFDILLNQERRDEFKEFWSSTKFGTFKYTAIKVFPYCLNSLESQDDYDMRNSFDMKFLIIRLIQILNIRIHPIAYSQFLNSRRYIISLRDIEDVDATIKYPTIIDVAAGNSLIYEVQRLLLNHKVPPLQAQRWIDLAQHKLKMAQKSIPLSGSVTVKLASTYLLKANSTGSIKDSLSYLRSGSQIIQQASKWLLETNSELLAIWGMIHLKLATHYLFYGQDYVRFKTELDVAQERLEKALSINSSSLESYLHQALPFEYDELTDKEMIGFYLVASGCRLNSHNTGVEQRKLYELFSLILLMDQCAVDSTLKTFIPLAIGQVREITQLEIPINLSRIIAKETVGDLFQHLPNIHVLGAKRITFTPNLALAAVSMKFLTSLQLTDCYFHDDAKPSSSDVEQIPETSVDPYHPIRSMADLLREILIGCTMLVSLTISSRSTDDKTFEGIAHLFGQIKQLSISQGYVSNKTLLELAPHLTSLLSLSLSYSYDINDNGMIPLLQALESRPIKLKELYINLPAVTDETGKQIAKMASELEVLMLVRLKFSVAQITEILSNLTKAKILDLSSSAADASSIEALENTASSLTALYLDHTSCGDEQSIQALSNFSMPDLITLHLPRYKGDGQLLWSLIRKLPNLERLRLPPTHIPYLMGVYKEHIDSNDTVSENPLSKIKWLDLTMSTVSYESLQELLALCPMIESLSLSAVTYIQGDRCIVVEFNDSILNQFMKLYSPLYELNLSNHKTLEKRHLQSIITHCPVLRKLSCYGCEKITAQVSYDTSIENPNVTIDS